MIDTIEAALAEVERLGLPPVFRVFLTGVSKPGTPLPDYPRWECRPPHTYFTLCYDLVESAPSLRGLCPLWEQNGEAIVGRRPGGDYVRYYYEDTGDGAIEVLGANYQQFVTEILVHLADAGLFDEHGKAVASALEYRDFAMLKAVLDGYTDERGETDLARFKASLVN